MARQPMSMEAMLDEERREVLALLEGSSNPRPRPPSSLDGRSPSPYTPRSPVRSMLDIGDDPAPLSPVSPKSVCTKTTSPGAAPVRSMLDVNGPPAPPVRSMLDVDSPSPSAKQVLSTPSSPTDSKPRTHAANNAHPRSMSDTSARPVDFGPRMAPARVDPTSEYQFSGIITNNAGQALPKRVTQGGKRATNAMAEIMRGNDVSGLVLPGDRGRHQSASGPSGRLGNKSKSPHNRLGMRSHSPRAQTALGRALSPAGRAVLNDPDILDYNNAYRRLSDAALARSGGSLSELGRRKNSNYMTGNGRLQKDYLGPDGELLIEESSDEGGSSSDEEGRRGRRAARTFDKAQTKSSSESPEAQRQVRSLLAAAEEERTFTEGKPALRFSV